MYDNSGHWRSRQLCRLCVCACDSRYAFGRTQCADRVSQEQFLECHRQQWLTPRSAVLGSYFLKERLGTLGKLGCAMCLLGSVVIVLHAPPDKPVERIDEILAYAVKPGELRQNLSLRLGSSHS